MSDSTQDPPRRRGRWPVRLLVLLLLGLGTVLALDATGGLPSDVKRLCEQAGLCGHGIFPGAARSTRLEFTVGADRQASRATRAFVQAERQGDEWTLALRIEALPGAPRYSLIQVLATRERAAQGGTETVTLHDENRQPVVRGHWELVVTVPNEIFRNRDWALRYRADTIDALAISEDIAPFVRQTGAIR